MLKSICIAIYAAIFVALVSLQSVKMSLAQEPDKPLRELFVPIEELDVLLGNDVRRVYMTRAEYEDLLIKAHVKLGQLPPAKLALLVANYQAIVEKGRATIRGELQVEVLDSGLQVLPLSFSGVGIRAAQLDDMPAALASNEQGQTLLFVEGVGQHRLILDLNLPIANEVAQQTLQFQIPTAPTGELKLTVAGNIEIKSGASVVSREVDDDHGTTHFKILPTAAPMSMVMSLNNRTLRDRSTVVARGVLIAEITQAYERLHATMSMGVLNGSTDEFRFAIDDELEVNTVTSELLSRWSIEKVDGQQQLIVTLRAPTSERTVVNIRLDRITKKLAGWQFPKFEPIAVAGYSAVVGLLADERLSVSAIAPESLIAIDGSLLTAALPASLLTEELGSIKLNVITAYYAAQAQYALAAEFSPNAPRVIVSSNMLLTVSDRGQEVDGGFSLMPQNEKLFYFEFECPSAWSIDWIKTSEQQLLKFDRFAPADSATSNLVRIRVSLLSGAPIGGLQRILFRAQITPSGWLSKWASQSIQLPKFRVLNAESQFGAVAVQLQDDLLATPESTTGLLVMNAEEKARFQLTEYNTALAYRFDDTDWDATLTVVHTTPRAIAQVLSFVQLSLDSLTSHTEITYDVKQARLQNVAFTLPESTPVEVAVRGLGETVVKETASVTTGGLRQWTVQLAERKAGEVRLAVDFTQPLNTDTTTELLLPIARSQAVAYQTGSIALEGHPELAIEMVQSPRAVDIGELVDAEYQVGKRLIGVFGYVGVSDEVTAKISRRPVHRLPTTIVERAELVTLVSVHGSSQTAARFKLRTKATYIETRLPAEAKLWSVLLDGKPALPQSVQDRVLIALPPNKQLTSRDLQFVLQSPTDKILLRGEIGVVAPVLFEREEIEAENVLIPMADVNWNLVLPSGYRVSQTSGSLQPSTPIESTFTIDWLSTQFWKYGGGQQFVSLASSNPRSRNSLPEAKQEDWSAPVPPTASISPSQSPAAAVLSNATSGYGTNVPSITSNADSSSLLPTDGESAGDKALQDPALRDPARQDSALQDPAFQDPAFQDPAFQDPGLQDPGLQDPGRKLAAPSKEKLWAMEGVRSLAIQLDSESAGQTFSFTSLGNDPYARVTIVHQPRMNWFALAVGLAVFFIGCVLIPARRTARVRYFFGVAVVACLAPPLTGWLVELEPITAAVMCSLVATAGWLLLVELIKRVARRATTRSAAARIQPNGTKATAVVAPGALCFLLVAAAASPIQAQGEAGQTESLPGQLITSDEQLSRLIKAFQDGGKVSLPNDAVVIPFDASQPGKFNAANKLLVPYDKYLELWNRAYPDKKLASPVLPAQFAWSTANYAVTLNAEDSLQMTATIAIEQFSEQEIAVPMQLSGCVIESATLNGQSPRLHLLGVEPQSQSANQPTDTLVTHTPVAGQSPPPAALYVLYTQGTGRKQLELKLRWQLDKRSGWRTVAGILPSTPAAELSITVPQPKTEVKLAGGFDQGSFETTDVNERIVTSLAADGRLSLNWRDKITEATIDQGLTVQARSVFDIQEDALKLAWHGQFEFRRGRRESFTLQVPKEYLVEKVVGANIRGWSIKPTETAQQMDVELLKAVSDRESITVFISKQTALDPQTTTVVDVPKIAIPDAKMHQGHVTVRRSLLLDVRAAATTNLARMEAIDETAWMQGHEIAAILPIKVYQAYRYAQVPFELKLSVSSVPAKMRVQSQSLLKISQRELALESRLMITSSDRPIYRLQISLPAEWKMQMPEVPGNFQWSLNPAGDRQLMQTYMANGRLGDFTLILRGKLTGEAQIKPPIALPRIEVLEAERHSGAIVVQADPAYDVRAENLQGCESALLDSVKGWLASNQREAARSVVRFDSARYSGQLQVTTRTPSVSSFSVTNVKVTDRAIEETLFIEANIRSAGIREFVFQMPESLANAKIQAPHVRQTIIQPVPNAAGSVRVQLLLQEEIMGQFRVVIEHDRELTAGPHTAPLAVIETGATDRRLVTLENVGRDELLTLNVISFEPLDRSQLLQRFQADLLGGRSSQAYMAKEDGVAPLLTFETKSREVLATAGARIGLAQTQMIVDAMGTYRASQEYRVENRTEPFLEIEMPAGSSMWTVLVAGEPVKPAVASSAGVSIQATPLRIRIPLIKTAEGDLDYPVVIKYGGQLEIPTWLSRVKFPLISTRNINVEVSQVRLRLPATFDWYNFGGTLGRVNSESELQAGWLSYRTRQLTELSQMLAGQGAVSDYTKFRALNNLSTLEATIEQSNQYFSKQGTTSDELKKQLNSNSAALQTAQQQAAQVDQRQNVEARDNRKLLNNLYGNQSNARSFNSLGDLGGNFSVQDANEDSQVTSKDANIKNEWLSQNKLDIQPADAGSRLSGEPKFQTAKPQNQSLQTQLATPLDSSVGAHAENAGKKVAPPQRAAGIDTAAERYGRRLQEQNANRFAQQLSEEDRPARDLPPGPPGMQPDGLGRRQLSAGGPGSSAGQGLGGRHRESTDDLIASNLPLQIDGTRPSIQNASAAKDAFMASLDVELPVRGHEYFFTTPRGAVELSAQGFSTRVAQRLYSILFVIALAAAAWAVYALHLRLLATRWGAALIACVLFMLGTISLLLGWMPVYGGLALMAAMVLVAVRLEP